MSSSRSAPPPRSANSAAGSPRNLPRAASLPRPLVRAVGPGRVRLLRLFLHRDRGGVLLRGLLEFPHGLAEALCEGRKLGPAEKQQEDEENQDPFPATGGNQSGQLDVEGCHAPNLGRTAPLGKCVRRPHDRGGRSDAATLSRFWALSICSASKKPCSWRMRVGWRILRRAFASIWRIRSRVTLNCLPTSSSVLL